MDDVLYKCFFFLDGVAYRITLQRADDGYLASWLCPVCKVEGGTDSQGDCVEDAGRRAISSARDHHDRMHRQASAHQSCMPLSTRPIERA